MAAERTDTSHHSMRDVVQKLEDIESKLDALASAVAALPQAPTPPAS